MGPSSPCRKCGYDKAQYIVGQYQACDRCEGKLQKPQAPLSAEILYCFVCLPCGRSAYTVDSSVNGLPKSPPCPGCRTQMAFSRWVAAPTRNADGSYS